MNTNSKLYPLVCLITGLIIIAAGIYTLSAGDVVLHVASLIGGGVVTSADGDAEKEKPFRGRVDKCAFRRNFQCIGGNIYNDAADI